MVHSQTVGQTPVEVNEILNDGSSTFGTNRGVPPFLGQQKRGEDTESI